ncbi:glycosyltransferase [Algoriphagus aestuariicola]|uniref:Glycosyltransferase n=1 Tax=Algoriphagus aestuariicola TaxID=1852016 RepID=A0ABS3BNS4_9BACT|nr:glycosyltransferase [Algoriphagus aestuariicola]MBN7799896.1 glycosyltransferase [Algoriphagus aestuariicola]
MLKIALICSHNGEDFIAQQVESIAKQSLPVDFIIVHDYLSTDSTREKIKGLSETYSNLSFVFFDFAKSACHSFLNSIAVVREAQAGSDYVLYLCDQDDVWTYNKNERVYGEIQGGAEFVFHDVIIADSDLNPIKTSFYHKFWEVHRDFVLPSLFLSNCVIGHTIALSSGFLNQLDLDFDERIPMHDWYISLTVLHRSVSYSFIPEQLSFYRQHSSNVLGASQANPLSKIKKSHRHGKALLLYQEFLLSKGFPTTTNLLRLFRNSLSLRPFSKLGFIVLTLTFSSYFKATRQIK